MAETEEDEDVEEEEEDPRARSSLSLGFAALLLLGGIAIAGFIYQSRRGENLSSEGLDLEAPALPPEPQATAVEAAAPAAPRTYGVTSSLTAPVPSAPPPRADPRDQSRSGLQAAIWKHERFFRKLTFRYQNKHPVFHKFGNEWAKHPDLAKARDDWYQHKNPIKFAYQIAQSPNFAKMVVKYARDPALLAYMRELASSAPREVVTGLTDYLSKDKNATSLVERFAKAAGLPPALVAGFTGKKVDQAEVMKQLLENPALKGGQQGQPAAPR